MNRYLLIDDDFIITMIHKAVIKKADVNHTIDTVTHGSEALFFLKQLKSEGIQPPDIIFVDINMPIMSGFEFLDNLTDDLLEFLKHAKVIMLSSSIDPRDTGLAKKYPIVKDFVSKPLSIEYISSLIKKEPN